MCMGARARTRARARARRRVMRVGGLTRQRTNCDDCGVLINNNNTKGNRHGVTRCGKCYLASKQKQREG